MRLMIARGVNGLWKLMPLPVMVLMVHVRSWRARRNPSRWAEAKEQMRFVVGPAEPDEVVDRLALGYIKRSIWLGESRWRPRLVTHQPVEGAHHLHDLRSRGTGFVINTMHHGNWEGVFGSLARIGITTSVVSTSEMFQVGMPLWMQQQARVLRAGGGADLIDVGEGMPAIRAALGEGRAVTIASDLHGRTPVRFLGREIAVVSGAARAAC